MPDSEKMEAISGNPRTTFEHVRYAYAERPDDACHRTSMAPTELVEVLHRKGLPDHVQTSFSERHGGVRDAWANVLANAEQVVCLDAHLDMYTTGDFSIGIPGPGGKKLLVGYTLDYREMAAGLPSLPYLSSKVAALAQEAAWEQAWVLLLLKDMPKLSSFTWVVPNHFAAGLAVGFPYPHAQWMRILEAGQKEEIWHYRLNPAAQNIEIEFIIPELEGRRLVIDVVTLQSCPSLKGVDADHVHVCRSPHFLHPAADIWVDELLTSLNPDRS